jgi:acetyltransferase-like isoleucine patch superfamily enzyme
VDTVTHELEEQLAALDREPLPRHALGFGNLIEYEGGIRASPFVVVHPGANIGRRCTIWHFAIINEGAILLEDCVIGSGVWIGRHARIGNRVRMQDKAHITPSMYIGNDVFIGHYVVTCNDRRPRAGNQNWTPEPPVVEDGASIGGGAVILPGVRIGAGAMIGAGAVVSRDVPPGAVVRGEPARITGRADIPSGAVLTCPLSDATHCQFPRCDCPREQILPVKG